MIQNVVMASFESILFMFLSKNTDANVDENQVVRSYGTQTITTIWTIPLNVKNDQTYLQSFSC